ncbi:hypothetical protein RCL1_002643 [Eukaryota sp. TZLM3-RCL]
MRHSQVLLTRQFQQYQQHPIEGVSFGLEDGNIYKWKVTIIGPSGTPFENGLFQATMVFPESYPMNPPSFKFKNFFYHPNIYPSGEVCISILHPPGDETALALSGDRADETWSPVQSPESIVISIISMLVEPNPSSPANVDAAIEFRENRRGYEQKIRRIAQRSVEDI